MRSLDRRCLLRGAAALGGLALGPALQRTPLAQRARADGAFDLSAGVPGCGQVAFMFNVGSGYAPAYNILDTLSAYGLSQSMFVMGWLADANPGLVQTIAAYGHPVGTHGYNPPELTLRSDDDVAWDIQAGVNAVGNALGYGPSPWLTPFASASDWRVRSIANALGQVMVGWSVTSGDWSPDATADAIYSRVVGGAFDGAIFELHLDSMNSTWATATALPWIIDDLGAQGYRFVTVQQVAGGC
ncbi:MAG: polysaccharide deacetylase family protein [Thermomicrobiales bacterium]|nr:polysaccharide deacetylase family protein [Thermomicrobiales bacterium]